MTEVRTIGWLLDEADRATLLSRFPPAWPDIVAHHVTLASKSSDPLPVPMSGEVVGHVDDGQGLQALVVAIGGTTDRPDGSTYHITWSLDRGQRPRAQAEQRRAAGAELGPAGRADPDPADSQRAGLTHSVAVHARCA
jgi:hypothetical protein